MTNHILQHIPEGIGQFGPVHSTWMFAYERFNSWLCRRALNRRHPKATILRTYQVMISSFHAVNKFSVSYTIFCFLIIQPYLLIDAIMLIPNGSVELRGVTWGDCIHWKCNLEVIFQHKKMSEINILFYEQLAGVIERSSSQHKQVYRLVCTLARR